MSSDSTDDLGVVNTSIEPLSSVTSRSALKVSVTALRVGWEKRTYDSGLVSRRAEGSDEDFGGIVGGAVPL
jgi:hypothetical protein